MTSNPHRMPDGRARRRNRLGTTLSSADLNVLADYRDHLRQRALRPATIDKYNDLLLRFGEHIYPRRLIAAKPSDVLAFVDQRHLGARARYHCISSIHLFFGWALLECLCEVDPTVRVPRPRFPRSIPRPIPDGELHAALAGAERHIRAMLALAAFAGLRAGEIANLQREDILDTNVPPVLIVTSGKGGHQRVLPLHPEAWEMIRPITHGRHGWLFTTPSGAPVQSHNVSAAVNTYLHDIGIASSCHSLRHWYGTKVYAASKDLRVTQALMGHASPNTTVGYVAWSAGDAHTAVNRIPLPGAG